MSFENPLRCVEIFSSYLSDAAQNLAFEEYLLETLPKATIRLLFYRNSDSVVIGRHQNPWLESNVPFLKKHGIKLIRRISGGGAVFHDAGNLNFSFIMEKEIFNRERNLTIILRALDKLGIRGDLNKRFDLMYGDRKFSGNAFCFRRGKVIHHGTILLKTTLHKLRLSLQGMVDNINTAATRSTPSPVLNLCDVSPALNPEEVEDAVKGTLRQVWGKSAQIQKTAVCDFPDYNNDKIEELYRRNLSWEWNYGRTPDFYFFLPSFNGLKGRIDLKVKKGFIVDVYTESQELKSFLIDKFKGSPFEPELVNVFFIGIRNEV
ncbi:MAG: hypothetical protein DRP87_01250 [Spirochaetes bacterium]|nr:MAG: hypothetical protein DRP87_01250 [Spirochaetota bacterium]